MRKERSRVRKFECSVVLGIGILAAAAAGAEAAREGMRLGEQLGATIIRAPHPVAEPQAQSPQHEEQPPAATQGPKGKDRAGEIETHKEEQR